MIYLQLFFSFFKIGLFSFGGGYGMIPLIERELMAHSWLSNAVFIKIISVSEMTPGPVAVNTATFVGYKVAGFWGGLIATTGVVMPSFILILGTAYILNKYKSHPLLCSVLNGVKPVVLALIIYAAVFVGRHVLFNDEININNLTVPDPVMNFLNLINPFMLIITAISMIMLFLLKINPILVLLTSGIMGAVFHFLGFI
jgi:chromate transporter